MKALSRAEVAPWLLAMPLLYDHKVRNGSGGLLARQQWVALAVMTLIVVVVGSGGGSASGVGVRAVSSPMRYNQDFMASLLALRFVTPSPPICVRRRSTAAPSNTKTRSSGTHCVALSFPT